MASFFITAQREWFVLAPNGTRFAIIDEKLSNIPTPRASLVSVHAALGDFRYLLSLAEQLQDINDNNFFTKMMSPKRRLSDMIKRFLNRVLGERCYQYSRQAVVQESNREFSNNASRLTCCL